MWFAACMNDIKQGFKMSRRHDMVNLVNREKYVMNYLKWVDFNGVQQFQ